MQLGWGLERGWQRRNGAAKGEIELVKEFFW